MGEFDHIAWIRQRTQPSPRVLVGPGDDCAVIGQFVLPKPAGDAGACAGTYPASSRVAYGLASPPWLVTTDMLLEGSHFILADVGPRRVGRKAMAVNLSDIAAMGGKPVAAFVSVGLPRAQTQSLGEELYLGLREIADAFDTMIAGGDTNSWAGGLVVSVTVLGEPGPQGPILRSGAKSGDWLLVTGQLGGSILGKHLDFVPRVREGLLLQEHAQLHALIDISDGLSADVFHLCEESGCGAMLLADNIPISDAARRMNDGKSPLDHALGDGEDFELALAVNPADGERLLRAQPIAGITLAHVGVFLEEKSLFLQENGTVRRIEPRGYVHAFA